MRGLKTNSHSSRVLLHVLELASMSLLLAACSRVNNFADLQAFVDEVDGRASAPVEPVPEFVPYEGFIYGAASLRSPFEAPIVIELAEGTVLAQDVQPDLNRRREFLEGQSLSEISMVGMLTKDGVYEALLEDGFGEVHRVGVGNFLGRNHGRILNISSAQVRIMEIVPSGNGGWIERPQTLTMQ